MNPDLYVNHSDLKLLIKRAGLTVRDVALVFGMTPSCLNNQLSGYAPLQAGMADRIRQRCTAQIKRIKEEQHEKEKLSVSDDAGCKCPKAKKKAQSLKEIREEMQGSLAAFDEAC